jgi:hypothetical protein
MIQLALALQMMYKFTPVALLTRMVEGVGTSVNIFSNTTTTTTTTTTTVTTTTAATTTTVTTAISLRPPLLDWLQISNNKAPTIRLGNEMKNVVWS